MRRLWHRLRGRRWQPGSAGGDVLAGVHVQAPPVDTKEDRDAILSDIWEELEPEQRLAEEEELADDIRRLRPPSSD